MPAPPATPPGLLWWMLCGAAARLASAGWGPVTRLVLFEPVGAALAWRWPPRT
jgi:hypothetical protein